MKKIILILLCFVLLLSGCENLSKAEPYYTETKEGLSFSTQYKYIFDDETSIRCVWKNESSDSLSFYDTFELHLLGNDGEWYLVTKGGEVSFNTNYRHGIDPESESNARYDISVYTDKLKDGETYRISTYCFDDNGNNYQVFAEFTCDNKLAEEEIKEISGGLSSHRSDPSPGGSIEIVEKND
ncbi:MAG: hypothetical protein IJA05_01335 [Oscillospiraceae bacterium]|nr:hypothetical protein [Oscillospiraceae bacterium]